MRKIISLLFLTFTINLSAQVEEQVLADTITYINREISALKSIHYGQSISRLNFDDCNLEYERSFKSDDAKWLMYDMWLFDLDEDKMRLDFEKAEWKLKLVSTEKKIELVSSNNSGFVSEMYLYSKEKEPLMNIGKALYFAIKSCKILNE